MLVPDRKGADTARQASQRGDAGVGETLAAEGKGLWLNNNTRLRLLARQHPFLEVEVLDGSHAGAKGLIDASYLFTDPPEAGTAEPVNPKHVDNSAKPTSKLASTEEIAASQLRLAKRILDGGDVVDARKRLQQLIRDHPSSKAAADAKQLLERIKQ